MPARSLSNIRFVWNAPQGLLCLRQTALAHYTGGGGILSSGVTNEKHKNTKNMPPNRPQKGQLFAIGELKQEGRTSLCWTSFSRNHARRACQLFHHFAFVHKWPQKHCEYWFGITSRFQRRSIFTTVESANSKDQPYLTTGGAGAPADQKKCRPHYLRPWGPMMCQERIFRVLLGAGSWGALVRAQRKSCVTRSSMETTANYQSIMELSIWLALSALPNANVITGQEVPDFSHYSSFCQSAWLTYIGNCITFASDKKT